MIQEIINFNEEFVNNKLYEPYITSKFPDKKVAILSCMDTRLTELLPAALGLKNGDVKIIKNAGGIISHPFGSVVRSLLIAIYELGVEEIMVIGHTDCGVQNMSFTKFVEEMKEKGITQNEIDLIHYCGIDLESWLEGFDCVETSVSESVDILINHPLIPKDVTIKGFVMDSTTGKLELVK